MNIKALIGIILLIYAGAVLGMTITKPPKLWNIAKIKWFRDKLGEKGTVIFFFIWAALFAGIGFYLLF